MKKVMFFPFLGVIFLSACSLFQAGTALVANTQTPVVVASSLPPTQSQLMTAAPFQAPIIAPTTSEQQTATENNIALPIVQNQPANATEKPVVKDTQSTNDEPQMVKIFLIAIGDNGQSGELVGCGDSAVAVQVQIPHTQGVLRAALESLLAIKKQTYGESGLYNVLYQSDLQLKSVVIKDGVATIQLTGKLILGGVCDDPRVLAELKSTALQFSTVKDVAIFLNGKPIQEVLSEK